MALDPLVGSALVSGGASILGNIFGFGSTNQTNKTNMRIAQMNNEFNERMLQKQMDYNTQMWEKENEYNSAVNQRKRLQEAGINPYLAMSGQNAGTAGSVGGVNPPTATPVQAQPYNFDFSGVGNAIQNYMQMKEQQRVNNAQIDHVNADVHLKKMQAMTTLMDSIASTHNKNAQSLLFKAQEKEISKLLSPRYERELNAVHREKAEIRNTVINGLLLSKELSIFDEKTRIQLSEAIQRIAYHAAVTGKTNKEAAHEVQKQLETQARTNGIKISNSVAERTADALVERAIQETLPAIGKFGENIGDWFNNRKYGQYR